MIKAIGLFALLLLKLLGWMLLVFVLLVIVCALLVILVPVRYRVEVHNTEDGKKGAAAGFQNAADGLQMQFRFTWLIHFIHITFCYGHKKFQNKIRIAGIDVLKMFARIKQRKADRRKKHSKRKKAKKSSGQESGKKAVLRGRKAKKNAGRSARQEEEENTTEIAAQESEKDAVGSAVQEQKKNAVGSAAQLQKKNAAETAAQLQKKHTERPARQLQEKNTERPARQEAEKKIEQGAPEPEAEGKAKGQVQTAQDTKGSGRKAKKARDSDSSRKAKKEASGRETSKTAVIKGQAQRFHQEFTDETNRTAVKLLWKEICCLITHYKPAKLKADLTFSMADPALTGKVLGMLSLLPFLYRYPCNVIPDFDSDICYIEGSFMLQGKISVGVFLLSLLRLIRKKEVMQCVRRLTGRNSK